MCGHWPSPLACKTPSFYFKIAFNDWGVDIKRIGSRCGRLREKNKVHDDDKTVEKSFAEKESAVPGLFYFLSFS